MCWFHMQCMVIVRLDACNIDYVFKCDQMYLKCTHNITIQW